MKLENMHNLLRQIESTVVNGSYIFWYPEAASICLFYVHRIYYPAIVQQRFNILIDA